jgi:hypothetical protein
VAHHDTARHRTGSQRSARHRILVAVTAASLSGALVLGHATNSTVLDAMVQLTNTVIGAGGRGDPLGARVQQKLSATVQPTGYGYEGVHYPATIDLAGSRDAGVPIMKMALASHSSEEHLIVVSYSEGSLVAERVRRDLQARPVGPGPNGAPSAEQLTFVMIASPFAPNGGLYSRFPGLFVPFVIEPVTPSQPTRYDTTYHALEYDTFADFPAYFNPLALLNSVLALRYGHPDMFYDTIDPTTTPHLVKEVENSAGGTDTYILYRNPHLPLLGPIRELASILRVTPFIEPLLGAIEPLLRLVVDMAYTDRTYAHADVNTPFSLFTPPDRIIAALLGVPGAIQEGLNNLLSGVQTALAASAPSIAAAASASASPSDVTQLHDKDLTAAKLVENPKPTAPQAEAPQAETVAAQPDIEAVAPEEATGPTQQTGPTEPSNTEGRKPTLTSDGNKVTPIGAAHAPATSTGTGPVTTAATETTDTNTEPDTDTDTDTKPEPDTEPDTKASAPQNEMDHKDAAA